MAQLVVPSGYIEMIGTANETVSVSDALGGQIVLVLEKGLHVAVPSSAHDELVTLEVAKDVSEE